MSMQTKLIAILVLLAAMFGACTWFGSHERAIGAAGVQAKWDAAKAVQAQAVANAKAANAAQALDWTRQFAAITSQYEATTHAQAPSIANTVAADVDAGRLRLRDGADVCPGGGEVSAATARSRAADAAATQALADRTATAIAVVRIGDAANKREADFRALIEAQRAILTAERVR